MSQIESRMLSEAQLGALSQTLTKMDGVVELWHAKRSVESPEKLEQEAFETLRESLPVELRARLCRIAVRAQPFARRITYVYAGDRLCASIWRIEDPKDIHCELRWAEAPKIRPALKPMVRTRPQPSAQRAHAQPA